MKKLFLLSLVVSFVSTKAQIAYSWAKQTGGTNADDSQCIAYDASGNVYIAGAFQGTVDFDPGPGTTTLVSAGSDDAFISKFDANGNFLAVYTFTNNLFCRIYGIAIDNGGNIITTGGFSGSVDFDPGVGVNAKTSNGLNDIFICKLNSSGVFQWVKTIGSVGLDDYGISITTDVSSNVLVTGYFQGTNINFDIGATNFSMSAAGKDVFVLKLSTAGVFSLAFKIGSVVSTTADAGQSIKTDASGNIYVGGYFGVNVDFDPGLGNTILTGAGGFDAFVAKYTSIGTFVWVSNFAGVDDEICYSLSIDPSGNIYSTGTLNGVADFDPTTGTFNLTPFSINTEDVFVSKLSPLGNLVWAKQLGGVNGDFGTAVSSDASGVYISGYFNGVADFDPSATSTINLISSGASDIFIAKLDPSGNYVFAKRVGGSGVDFGRAILTPSVNLIYITGSFNSTVDYDISPIAITMLTSNGNADAYLAKYIPCPAQSISVTASSPTICAGGSSNLNVSGAVNYTWSTGATTSSISVSPTITTNYSVTGMFSNGCLNTNTLSVQVNTCSGIFDPSKTDISIRVYPNPVIDVLTIDAETNFDLKIVNVLGQIVMEGKLMEGMNTINAASLTTGIHYLVIEKNGSRAIKKVVIAK